MGLWVCLLIALEFNFGCCVMIWILIDWVYLLCDFDVWVVCCVILDHCLIVGVFGS